jgi:hypothetical protein
LQIRALPGAPIFSDFPDNPRRYSPSGLRQNHHSASDSRAYSRGSPDPDPLAWFAARVNGARHATVHSTNGPFLPGSTKRVRWCLTHSTRHPDDQDRSGLALLVGSRSGVSARFVDDPQSLTAVEWAQGADVLRSDEDHAGTAGLLQLPLRSVLIRPRSPRSRCVNAVARLSVAAHRDRLHRDTRRDPPFATFLDTVAAGHSCHCRGDGVDNIDFNNFEFDFAALVNLGADYACGASRTTNSNRSARIVAPHFGSHR